MSLFNIRGTVTAVGQSQFDNNLTIFAYLEVTEMSGRRILIDKVAVCNDTSSLLQLGGTGEFFFDKMFIYGRKFHCQLWGIKADNMAVLDRNDLRKMVMAHHILYGLFLLPFFGVGLFCLLPALASLMTTLSGGVNRSRCFYGSNPSEARRLQQQQSVRI